MSKHYYELIGELAKKAKDLNARRMASRRKMFEFAKAHGFDDIAVWESTVVTFYCVTKTLPPPKEWKSHKQDRHYLSPRLGTKEGKLLDRQMRDICIEAPSGADLGEMIGMPLFGGGDGLFWQTPGMNIVGKRVFVVVPERWKPPAKVAKEMVRLSDVEYEKLTKAKKVKVA